MTWRTILWISAALLFLASCAKETEGPSGSAGGNGNPADWGFYAEIFDTSHLRVSVDEVKARLVTGNAGNVDDYFEIYMDVDSLPEAYLGLRQWGENLTMSDIVVGDVQNFTLALYVYTQPYVNEQITYTNPIYQSPDSATIGQFTFTEVSSTHVAGTFSFIGQSLISSTQAEVRNGSFYAEIE